MWAMWTMWTAEAAETAGANHVPPTPVAHRTPCARGVTRRASGPADFAGMVVMELRTPRVCLAWPPTRARWPARSRAKRQGAGPIVGSVVGSIADSNAPPLARRRHGARSLRAAPTTRRMRPVRTPTGQNPSDAASVRPAVANEARAKPPKRQRTQCARGWHRSSWLGRDGAHRGCPQAGLRRSERCRRRCRRRGLPDKTHFAGGPHRHAGQRKSLWQLV